MSCVEAEIAEIVSQLDKLEKLLKELKVRTEMSIDDIENIKDKIELWKMLKIDHIMFKYRTRRIKFDIDFLKSKLLTTMNNIDSIQFPEEFKKCA